MFVMGLFTAKSNRPFLHARIPAVFLFWFSDLLNLPLQHLLRHLPFRRVRIRAPRMNRIHAGIEDVSSAQPA